MVDINREELAWAAGFFDGEGCCTILRQKVSKRYGTRYVYPCLSIGQTDPRVLNRFKAAVLDLGTVRGPYRKYQPKHREQWRYVAENIKTSQVVVALLWSFLSKVKRDQISRVFKECQNARAAIIYRNRFGFCKRGHELSNTGGRGPQKKNGKNGECRACARENARRKRAKTSEAA